MCVCEHARACILHTIKDKGTKIILQKETQYTKQTVDDVVRRDAMGDFQFCAAINLHKPHLLLALATHTYLVRYDVAWVLSLIHI